MVWIFSGDSVEEIKEFIETHEIYFTLHYIWDQLGFHKLNEQFALHYQDGYEYFVFKTNPHVRVVSKPF